MAEASVSLVVNAPAMNGGDIPLLSFQVMTEAGVSSAVNVAALNGGVRK